MQDARLHKGQVAEVVLVGGSTRIPKMQQLLSDFFDGNELNKSINPDETAACGAAVMPRVAIQIYEGKHAQARNNNLLGEFELASVPPAPWGVPQINEAQRFQWEDEDARKRVDARNCLEEYVYILRDTFRNKGVVSKLDPWTRRGSRRT